MYHASFVSYLFSFLVVLSLGLVVAAVVMRLYRHGRHSVGLREEVRRTELRSRFGER